MKRNTPWGEADHVRQIANGIISFSTPRHGGILLTDARRQEMPAALRDVPTFAGGNWYEEDCDAGLVVLAFPQFFSPYTVRCAYRQVGRMAVTTLDNMKYYPRWVGLFDRWTGRTRSLAREITYKWEDDHKGQWESGSAWTVRREDDYHWGMEFTQVGTGKCEQRLVTGPEYLATPEVVENLPGVPYQP
jgi:hypothetical protein